MEFKNTEVFNFEGALRGMRNPMNSWDKSDSYMSYNSDDLSSFKIGKNDIELAQKLIKAGSEHCKFLRMIHVCVDIDMPRYWWSEADTYSFNTKNSCSTMHKLLNNKNPITEDLFLLCEEDLDIVNLVIKRLEELRQLYLQEQSREKPNIVLMNRYLVRAKRLLLEGFLQMRTVDTNYAEIRNMYHQRKHHRLKEEWIDTFCKWVETLPYAKELIIGE